MRQTLTLHAHLSVTKSKRRQPNLKEDSWRKSRERPMRTAYRCQASVTPEEVIQKAILEHYRICGRESAIMFHVPNGGRRSEHTAANLKAQGVQAGAPDIGGHFYGLAIKNEVGTVTKTQREFG